MTARRIFLDDRYRGVHGIGRYAQEVVARLRPDLQPLGLDGSPYTPLDSLRSLPGVERDALVYSPGYGALLRAPRQVLTVHDLIQLRLPWPGRAKFAAYYRGPVRRVIIRDKGRRLAMATEEFRRALGLRLGWNKVLSPTFQVERRGRHFVFRGRGFGSQVGLCLAGANAQAASGRGYRDILEFYYPRAEIGRGGGGR